MASSDPSLPPVHVPPGGGETVFLVGDTFAEIGTPGTRGAQAPPRTIADIEAMIAVAAKYRFAIEG